MNANLYALFQSASHADLRQSAIGKPIRKTDSDTRTWKKLRLLRPGLLPRAGVVRATACGAVEKRRRHVYLSLAASRRVRCDMPLNSVYRGRDRYFLGDAEPKNCVAHEVIGLGHVPFAISAGFVNRLGMPVEDEVQMAMGAGIGHK